VTRRFNPEVFSTKNPPQAASAEDTVNQYFTGTKFGPSDCSNAKLLVRAEGVIDVLKPGEFNDLKLTYRNMGWVDIDGSAGQMLLGDGGTILNYSDYSAWSMARKGMNMGYKAENIIKVGPGRYWGFEGPESKNGPWSGGWHRYAGTVLADEKCNSLKRLAYLITGSESDWPLLGKTDDCVKSGEVVDIKPLLNELENKIRPKVIAATSGFKAAGFGPLSVTITGGSPSDDIDQFFGKGGQLRCDCFNAVSFVLQKGLIDLIGSDLFDKLDDSARTGFSSRRGPINSMLDGDIGWFPNYSGYLSKVQKFKNQAYQAENVVRVGADQFWGFTGENEVHDQNGWERQLRDAYNAPDGTPAGTQRHGPIPGFSRPIRIDFFNVAQIGSQLFNLRNK
jgi:hypothetical protein